MGARAFAEYFEDQPRPIDDFCLPPPFEVALLDRAQRPVDDNEPDTVVLDQPAQALDHAAAEESSGLRARDARDLGADYIEPYRARQPDRLFQPGFDRTRGALKLMPSGRRLGCRMDNQGSSGRGSVCCWTFSAAQGSAISLFCSKSWIGCAGITVEIACLYTSCE